MMGSTGTHLNPTAGIRPSKPRRIPCVGLGYRQTQAMRARDILAANLKALLAASRISTRKNELRTLKQITAKSGGVLSNGKLDRIRRAEHATDIDSLGELAKVYKLEPWQLLVPDLNPEALPVIGEVELLQQVRSLVLSHSDAKSNPGSEVNVTCPSAAPTDEADTANSAERRSLALQSLRKGQRALDGVADASGKPKRVPRKGSGKRA